MLCRILLLLSTLVASAYAIEEAPPPGDAPIPEQPELPPPVQSGEALEPDVTIIRRPKETVEEYRINGHLYMVKVTPSIGPAYYLVDDDGDGQLESRRGDMDRGLKVPQWVLFSW